MPATGFFSCQRKRPCLELTANGLNFHYQQAGSGPDVVLIHGVTGDLSIWFLSRTMGVLAAIVPGDGVRPARPRLQRRPARDTRRPTTPET